MILKKHSYKALLIDLDGTMYHGDIPIEGASEFITYLIEAEIPFRFVTNNSSTSPDKVAQRLQKMGIPAREEHVCTSAQATAAYISAEKPGASIYMIGETGLATALTDAGLQLTDQNPDYVVQGIDHSFTYDKAAKAVQFLLQGCGYIQTNPDLLLPSTHGLTPGAGSIGAMLQAASGRKPVMIGKPSNILVQYSLNQLNIAAEDALVIGDNVATDIAAGVHSGCGTALVYTGLTNQQNYDHYTKAAGCEPQHIFETLQDLLTFVKKMK